MVNITFCPYTEPKFGSQHPQPSVTSAIGDPVISSDLYKSTYTHERKSSKLSKLWKAKHQQQILQDFLGKTLMWSCEGSWNLESILQRGYQVDTWSTLETRMLTLVTNSTKALVQTHHDAMPM